MQLRYYDRHGIVGHMADDGSVRLEPVGKMSWVTIEGVFSIVRGTLVALYRQGPGLLLRVGERVVSLEESAVEHKVQSGTAALTIRHARGVMTLEYEAPKPDPLLEFDPTPHVREEDFDLGLFIANVAADSERAQRLFLGDR